MVLFRAPVGFPIQNVITVQLLYQFFDPHQQLRPISLFPRGRLLPLYLGLHFLHRKRALAQKWLKRVARHAESEPLDEGMRERIKWTEEAHLHRFYYLLQKRN